MTSFETCSSRLLPTWRQVISGQQLSPAEDSAIIIQIAQYPDLKELADILTQSFHPLEDWLHWLYPIIQKGIHEDLRHRFREPLSRYLCLAALNKGDVTSDQPSKIVGTVEITLQTRLPWQSGPKQYLYLSNLAVSHQSRRQGIAQKLLAACEQVALDWKYQSLFLHVLENNYPARNLYQKAGYQLHQYEPEWSLRLFKLRRRLLLQKKLTV
jgi:ribosomal protein S18 acetylase RimI-like enzyme